MHRLSVCDAFFLLTCGSVSDSWVECCSFCCIKKLFIIFFFFFNDTATTEIYTLSLHDALPIFRDVYPAGSPRSLARAAPRLSKIRPASSGSRTRSRQAAPEEMADDGGAASKTYASGSGFGSHACRRHDTPARRPASRLRAARIFLAGQCRHGTRPRSRGLRGGRSTNASLLWGLACACGRRGCCHRPRQEDDGCLRAGQR